MCQVRQRRKVLFIFGWEDGLEVPWMIRHLPLPWEVHAHPENVPVDDCGDTAALIDQNIPGA